MFRLTTLLLLSMVPIVLKGETEVSTCGQKLPTLNSRILNTDETRHHWPWHAAIYHKYSIASDPIYQCGGTVISSKFVLTAAHCVVTINNNMQLDATNISVLLGRINLSESDENTDQSFEVAEIIVHQDFNSNDYANDIAIIKLSEDAQFNNYVKPACLWSNKTDIWEVYGKYGTVVGWGLTEKDRMSNVLRQADLPVISWSTCLKSNRDAFGDILSDTNYCAGFRNGTTGCQGDSGGSMTFEENGIYYIRGIVSVSPSRPNRNAQKLVCDPSQYALFTDVAQYLPWIRDKTKTCETKVRCNFEQGNHFCEIEVHHLNRNCKIIFDEASPKLAVTFLSIKGEFDVIPDLSDAVGKFENLGKLTLTNVQLKIVERPRLAVFGIKLSQLRLHDNEITQLDADTFDDLTYLYLLDLHANNISEIHIDLFEKLVNLRILYLNSNQIEILHQSQFRNNKKLTQIFMENNKLRKIEFQFENMPYLRYVNLEGNVCINRDISHSRVHSEHFINEILQNCSN